MSKYTVEYSNEVELDAAIEKIISDNAKLGTLIDNEVNIGGCFFIKMDEDSSTVESKGSPVKLKKVSPEVQVFTARKLHFVLIIDKHWWDNSSERQREGTIGGMLFCITVENKDRGLKVGKKPFDIQENYAAIESYGVYDEKTSRLKELALKLQNSMLTLAGSYAAKPTEPDADPDEDLPEEKPKVEAKPATLRASRPRRPITDIDVPDVDKAPSDDE